MAEAGDDLDLGLGRGGPAAPAGLDVFAMGRDVRFACADELGPGGVALSTGLIVTVAFQSFKARRPLTIIFSAALAGLFVVSLFDHYLWTLAPGRLLAGTMLGLWAGQLNDERGR